MKKPLNINNIINNKEYEKLRNEYNKLKLEFDKYKESTSDKLKEIESLLSQNEKIKKENEEMKKKLYKININTNTYHTNNQIKYNKEAYISLLEKQKEFLISMLLTVINLNIKNKINKDMILFQLDKNIWKEKEKEKFVNDIINSIQENKNNINNTKIINLRYRNNNIKNNNIFSINNFKFQILSSKVPSKNNKINNFIHNNVNDKLKDKKELELLRKINDMLGIIKKKKDILKYRKNNLSFRTSTIKEEK